MDKKDDLKWDNRELGADERYVVAVSDDKQKVFDDILNLVLVRFRMDKQLYNQLCSKAKEENFNVSAYIRKLIESDLK